MITIDDDVIVYIFNAFVDMRKSIDGLAYLVVEEMTLNPQEKALFLFRNKCSDKFKGILWDGDGFILLYKRLEKGRFKFPKHITASYYEIDADLFNWLRKGFDFYAIKQQPELKISQYY